MSLSPRLRRTLEIVYGVDGVAGARVWQWPGHVAIGVTPSPLVNANELLHRVAHATIGLREPDEVWDFGVLDLNEGPSSADPRTSARTATKPARRGT